MMTSDIAPRQADVRNDPVRIGLMSFALPEFDFLNNTVKTDLCFEWPYPRPGDLSRSGQ